MEKKIHIDINYYNKIIYEKNKLQIKVIESFFKIKDFQRWP